MQRFLIFLYFFLSLKSSKSSNFSSITHSFIQVCLCLGQECFVWGGVMLLDCDLFYKATAVNCFWKIHIVLKRTFKLFIVVVLKGID